MKKVKYFTRATLIQANREAIDSGRNRTLHEAPLRKLPDNLKFPVGFTMLHNDHEMRCNIAVAEDADGNGLASVWLDIPLEVYGVLPEIEVPA